METGGSSVSMWIMLILIFLVFFVIIKAVVALANGSSDRNRPSWRGIILSSLLGMLPLYLLLVFFGHMGDPPGNRL